jgi:hypothetical protein
MTEPRVNKGFTAPLFAGWWDAGRSSAQEPLVGKYLEITWLDPAFDA